VTFAVRSITRSAAGENIVHRPQLFDAPELTIGRGGDCEIRLPDLAVSLRHATLSQTGPDQVSVKSIGTEPFEAEGRFTTSATLALASAPKLTFGSHMLTLGLDPEGTVLVDVTRLDSAPEEASAANENRIFSLAGSGFSKRPFAWALVALGLALCLILPIATFVTHSNQHIHADKQWSTGPLSKSHAFLANNCQACHVKAFVSVRDETCLACHRTSKERGVALRVAETEHSWGGPEKVALVMDHAEHDKLSRAAPLPADVVGKIKAVFARTLGHPTDRCASCHLEHLADAPVKTPAGTPAPPQPHAIPVLRTTNTCAGCHAKLRESLGVTALRDTPDWRHHPEFRPLTARTPMAGSQPQLTRVSLVEHPSDYSGLNFSHKSHLSTAGGVARMAMGLRYAGGSLACADCHRPTKDGAGFQPVEMTRDCAACHSLAYGRGANGAPLMLPHGHADKVVATLQSSGYLRSAVGDASRRPPGFLARLGRMFSEHAAERTPPAETAKIRALFAANGLCVECHAAIAPAAPASLDYKIVAVNQTIRYLPRGGFNHGVPEHQHDAAGKPTCNSCHMAPSAESSSDLLLPRIATCSSCHGKALDKVATAASAECKECHSYHAPGMATPHPSRPPPKADVAAIEIGRRLD
jgi:hypothetical protein